MPRKTLQQLTDHLIREAKTPFTADLFLERIQERWNRRIALTTQNSILQRLPEHHFLIGTESRAYLPLGAVFEKIRHIPLALTLTRLERSHNLLIPGYRLIPFLSHEIPESQVTLLDEKNVEIPKLKNSFPLEEIFELYKFSNEHHFPDDIKINEWVPSKSSLNITVWDLSGFLKYPENHQTDTLLAELLDYDEGIFRLKAYPKREQKLHQLKTRNLYIALENILVRLNEDVHFPAYGLEKQLLRAFYLQPPSTLNVSAFSVKHFLDSLEKLSVVGCEWGNPRFIPSNKYRHWDYYLELAPRQPRGKCDSLDSIFHDLDLPFNSSEFKAILRNTLIRKTVGMEELVDLLFGGKGELFYSPKQEEVFYQLLRDQMRMLYLEIEKPEPRTISELRQKSVEVKLSLIKILKHLEYHEIELTDLPIELLDLVIELDSFCVESLIFLEDKTSPTNLKRVRDIQQAHKIIRPKLTSLESEIYYGLGFY